MNKMTLSVKLWGFAATLLTFIAILAGFSIWSAGSILDAHHDYGKAAHLEASVAEKEVDHLNWVGRINSLFIENKAALDIETDHTKCGLGKFIHSSEIEELMATDHEFAQDIKALNPPHEKLHLSA